MARAFRGFSGFVAVALLSAALAAQQRDTMALAAPPGTLSFLVVGDWGRQGSPDQRRVARQMGVAAAALRAAFVVNVGDSFYENGVKSVDDPQWRRTFEDVYTAPSLAVEWYGVLGNHDYHGNPQAEVDYTSRSNRWRMPARYYAVRKTVAPGVTAEFFFLDTSPFIVEYRSQSNKPALAATDTTAQRRWLDSALAASTAQWKFIIGHHHVYTGGERTTQKELAALLVARMKRYGVTAYLCGHEHHLEHILPEGSAPHYFISGAGAETRSSKGRAGTRFVSSSRGFMAMSLAADSMVVQVVDHFGRLLYRTSVRR